MPQSEAIRRIQQKLIALKYDLGKAGADGILGVKTVAAVTAFQKDKKLPIKWPGTIGPITLKALGLPEDLLSGGPAAPAPDPMGVPPWIMEARRRVGLHEVNHNKTLREWLKSDGHALGDPAKLPWCGDFVETPIGLTLPREPRLANPYWALNWTKFGVPVPDGMIPLGAIAAFTRNGGGHVGFVVGHDKTYYHILGGNQSNSVSIAKIAKSRQSGKLRWPSTYPLPTKSMPITTLNATVSTNEA